jgi:hypothetical protein
MTVPTRGLFVAPCSLEAADFDCRAYHYSRCRPAGRALFFGAWEGGDHAGCVVVSRGACANIGSPFDLRQDQVAEVTRVALRPGHVAPVSQVLGVVVRLLKKSNPGLEVLISYADQRQGHHGGVYQAAGWAYLGETGREATLLLHGRETHARTVSSRFGTRDVRWLREHVDPQVRRIDCPPKHKYALGLTPGMRARLAALAQPYPTREQSAGSGTPDSTRKGRCDATCSLHVSEVAHV